MEASPSRHVFLVGLFLSSEDMQKLPAPFCWKKLRRRDKNSVLQWKVTVFTKTRKGDNVPTLLQKEISASSRKNSWCREPRL